MVHIQRVRNQGDDFKVRVHHFNKKAFHSKANRPLTDKMYGLQTGKQVRTILFWGERLGGVSLLVGGPEGNQFEHAVVTLWTGKMTDRHD